MPRQRVLAQKVNTEAAGSGIDESSNNEVQPPLQPAQFEDTGDDDRHASSHHDPAFPNTQHASPEHNGTQRQESSRNNARGAWRQSVPEAPVRSHRLQRNLEHEAWRRRPSIKVEVKDPHHELQTRHLFEFFSQYGFVARISVDDHSISAVVTFIPPPIDAFWLTGTIRLAGRMAPLHVRLLHERPPSVISPSDDKVAYPAFVNVYVKELVFGAMVAPTDLLQMLTLQSKTEQDIFIQLNLKRKELDIRFRFPPFDPLEPADCGRVRVPFRDMTEVQCVNLGDQCAFIFSLTAPPEYYKRLHTPDIDFGENPWSEWSSWARQTECVHPAFLAMHEQSPVRMRTDHAVIDYGRWLTYRLIVDKGDRFSFLLKVLGDYNIRARHFRRSDFTFHTRRDASIWQHLELATTDPSYTRRGGHAMPSLNLHSGMAEMQSGLSHLPFPVLWQLMACISQNYLNEYNMTQEFLQKLNDIGQEQARSILERVADRKLHFHEPMHIIDQIKAPVKPRRVPPYCSILYSCSVTPTTIHFHSPVVEISNRVIRKHSEYQDRFLRVRFTQERMGRIHPSKDSDDEELFVRIRRFLKYGLILGDRHYEFLAFGNSQFREHGLYAFASIKGLAEIPDMTAQDIRSQLGNFDHIRIPAKWCARLGQNFSTTRAFSTVVSVKHQIPDIERNGYNFSDGVGKMSPFVASMIGMEFGRISGDPPSTVQFRLGGCKGILTMAPELTSRDVYIRKSQYKFQSQSTGLEIIRSSHPVSAILNRQLITVLSTLGVPNVVFTHMMGKLLHELEQAMTDKDAAFRLLNKHIDFNHMTLSMATMVLDGFMEAQDPFILSMLQLWRSWLTKYLKEKARIFVDKGACLFGTVDEYGVLKGHFHGNEPTANATREEIIEALPEIFVQLDAKHDGHYKPLSGVCMIVRNPSLHPGDVRVVHAVDQPALRHLRDVIVLPSTGDRDLGSMCSGGDLDGDDYLVIWDEAILPPINEWNNPAMDYSAQPPKPLNRAVTVDDIGDFFIQYIKNDQLSTIALAHLCWSDQLPDGVKDEKCLRLAQLHSQAVDYPKTGKPAQLTRDLRPWKWPHFMEKQFLRAGQEYKSKGVLGQLYDMVDRVNFVPILDKPFDIRILNAFDVSTSMLSKAWEIKQEYDVALERVMAQLDISTEFEVFSAFVMSYNRGLKEYTLAEELGFIMQTQKNRFREICAEVAGGHTYRELGPFLVAMYTVTAKEVSAALQSVDVDVLHDKRLPFISFPWIFTAELGNIATRSFRDNDIISVMTPAPIQTSRIRRKQAAAGKTNQPAPLIDLSDQLDIPIIDNIAAMNEAFSPQEWINVAGTEREMPRNSAAKAVEPAIKSAAQVPYLEAARITQRNAAEIPVSRSDSPISVHPSEATTARGSTPPSSYGGQDDNILEEEEVAIEEENDAEEEEEYVPEDDDGDEDDGDGVNDLSRKVQMLTGHAY